ncbi:MAG: L-histidine N(alpha)-methyltransferase [Alphaproteobacteria bacterium]|nr:L-histidine N(alpha)-methyltransferase [Alphaproteobacteria bacterium]
MNELIYHHSSPLKNGHLDADFFYDMLALFPDASGFSPMAGCVGKYIYDGDNWNEIVEESHDFYIPRGDKELMDCFFQDREGLEAVRGLPCVDFGVGGRASFLSHVLPLMRAIGSFQYTGVDFCEEALDRVCALQDDLSNDIILDKVCMDFFVPTWRRASMVPALGMMNGITVTNMYGSFYDRNIRKNLVRTLRRLSYLCCQGGLLLTIDTNQNEKSLRKAYETPLNSRLYLNVFPRMAHELPVKNFDPSGFEYAPEWHPDLSLWAHVVRATKSQDFFLGTRFIHLEKGQRLHLLNSYKFSKEFFESCCHDASLSVVHQFEHETGMMLYLLKDLQEATHGIQRVH